MSRIVLRFRSIEGSASLTRLYHYLRHLSSDFRETLAGEFINAGMQILMGEPPSHAKLNAAPPYMWHPGDSKISANARFSAQVDDVIYKRFCRSVVEEQNRNQFAFFIRTACLLGYHLHSSSPTIFSPPVPSYTDAPKEAEFTASTEPRFKTDETTNVVASQKAKSTTLSSLRSLGAS